MAQETSETCAAKVGPRVPGVLPQAVRHEHRTADRKRERQALLEALRLLKQVGRRWMEGSELPGRLGGWFGSQLPPGGVAV